MYSIIQAMFLSLYQDPNNYSKYFDCILIKSKHNILFLKQHLNYFYRVFSNRYIDFSSPTKLDMCRSICSEVRTIVWVNVDILSKIKIFFESLKLKGCIHTSKYIKY